MGAIVPFGVDLAIISIITESVEAIYEAIELKIVLEQAIGMFSIGQIAVILHIHPINRPLIDDQTLAVFSHFTMPHVTAIVTSIVLLFPLEPIVLPLVKSRSPYFGRIDSEQYFRQTLTPHKSYPYLPIYY